MSIDLSLKEMQQSLHRSFTSYFAGFLLSLVLTVIAFTLAYLRPMSDTPLIATLGALALVQAAIQLKCFLHLGEEGKPHWETMIFALMMLILLIIVTGTLWVMHDLNERTMKMSMEQMVDD